MIRPSLARLLILGAPLGATLVLAGTQVDPQAARAANTQEVNRLFVEQQRLYGTNAAFLVRPGLLADKSRREVRLSAESVRLRTEDPVEFPIIAANSGKDYEALAVAFAVPSDVHAALEFIGIPAGVPVDPSACRFWPKGERVHIAFRYRDETGASVTTRAEQLVIDTRTGKTLPEDDFVFTGSLRIAEPGNPSMTNDYAADVYSPNAIAAIYNEYVTVLDVPRRAQKNEVYNCQIPNPARVLPHRQLIEVTMTPGRTNNLPTVLDLTLDIKPARAPETLPAYELRGKGGALLNADRSQDGVATAVSNIVAGGRDPFVTICLDDSLTVMSVATACRWIASMDNERGMRVEAPPAGHPYFKAFLPNEKYRIRKERPVQPIELLLSEREAAPTGTVTFIEEEWKPDADASTYRETNFPAGSPEELARLLDRQDAPRVLLVFAPNEMAYGKLRRFIAPALTRRLILYVFLQRSDPSQAR